MFKTIIFQCGVIHVCSSSSTCEIILWMVKGVFITKEGHIPPQHGIPYVKCGINKEW